MANTPGFQEEMIDGPCNILIVEPYFGGSHKVFIDGLCAHLPFTCTRLTLPARKWKMRLQLAAPWMAARTVELVRGGLEIDLVLCSSFLDVAAYRAMLANAGMHPPLALYFHENQFAYPDRAGGNLYQFTALNFTSALAADRVAFNSRYNRDTFFAGVKRYLKKASDMDLSHLVEELAAKSTVLYPGMDYSGADAAGPRRRQKKVPVLAWNHRWEHDKDPETFFRALYRLSDLGVPFRLIVLGQGFARVPSIFLQARDRLAPHVLHFGYEKERHRYFRRLHQADIVVSTARHEFFGMAVMEAVRCGCRPLVPERLAYPELFPPHCRYPENGFQEALADVLRNFQPLPRAEALSLTAEYAWMSLAGRYTAWLAETAEKRGRG